MKTEKLKIEIVSTEGFSSSDKSEDFKPVFTFRIAEQAPNLVLPFTSKNGWTFISRSQPEVSVLRKIFFLRGYERNEHYKELVVSSDVFLSLLEAINEFNYSNAQSFQKIIDNVSASITVLTKKLAKINLSIDNSISAKDLLKKKVDVIHTVLCSELFDADRCPYCKMFNDDCSECSYAEKHGVCNNNDSTWMKLYNAKIKYLQALDEYADM